MKSSAFSLQRSLRLRGHAAAMRRHGTLSERALWQLLRDGQRGAWFRRQVVLDGCIVDFFAPSARLVVEVDGGYHGTPVQQRRDARRARRLERLGLRVLRLPADVVLTNSGGAVRAIRAARSMTALLP